MSQAALTIEILPETLAVCRLSPRDELPRWAYAGELVSHTRTPAELSIVCCQDALPLDVRASRDWRALQLLGPFDLSLVGVLLSVTKPLAEAGVGILPLGTFDTDYVLVREAALPAAVEALRAAGHRVLSPRIRVALPDDAAGVARVQIATWRAAYEGIMPAPVLAGLSLESSAAGWRRTLTEHPGSTLVALGPDEEVIGFSLMGRSRDEDADPATAEIIAFYVLPEHWGRGMGYRLWKASESALRRQGFRTMTLWTLEENLRGRSFYERVGMELENVPGKPFEVGGAALASVRYRSSLGAA